ncbi:MAG: excinuclease ABC subunit UvrA [bacterium]
MITIKGAREHNLKNIDLSIPRNKLVVVTGLSGSGKSSLAFDTIYAEGQRRYVESLSSYARQFLEQMEKPDVDHIEGLSPAIAIQQKAPSRNPRSTVGTTTEIYDYMRLLFARVGKPHCPECGREILPQSSQQIIEQVLGFDKASSIMILAPLVSGRKGEYRELFERIRKEGFARVRVDNKIYNLEEEIKLDKKKKHTIEVVVDRLIISKDVKSRLADSVETALKIARGVIKVLVFDKAKNDFTKEHLFSEHYACVHCGISLPEISPRMFSFNSPYGACANCGGLGKKLEVDPELVVPDASLSIDDGALLPWAKPITTRRNRWKGAWSNYYSDKLDELAKTYHFSLRVPFNKLDDKQKKVVLYGDGDFEGVINNLERRYRETESDFVKEEIYSKYIRANKCPVCNGGRLKKQSTYVTIGGKSIVEVSAMSIVGARTFFESLKLTKKEAFIAQKILKEIKARLMFLVNVGLDYITLERESMTLSGGEAQRIHLATQIGSSLVGVLYVLDEPTIGLHQRDNHRLLETLTRLRDLGNTLLVVEHDEATIRAADYIVDLGPGAGEAGGYVVCEGKLRDIIGCKKSLTAGYLNGTLSIPIPSKRREYKTRAKVEVKGAGHFNLKNIDVAIPLGTFTCVTGVSGSGKSTLVQEILYKALAQELYHSKEKPGTHKKIKGIENVDKVIVVDQSPIGRTPRSNPATYTGLFTPIREVLSQLPQARMRGYKPGRFSFNVKGGRCETCGGDGMIKIEMQFLPDVYIHCDTCKGARFNEETLEVRYKGKNIADILAMSVSEALEFFKNIPRIKKMLQTLEDVGLGYIKLGQPATTVSGGEAQRVKLATELGKRSTGRTIYILDEPTTGLHFADIHKLLDVLHRLTDAGNTVLTIEHNLDVIKTADYVIDLGPEGGDKGGFVVATGTPEEVSKVGKSFTGQFLKKVL